MGAGRPDGNNGRMQEKLGKTGEVRGTIGKNFLIRDRKRRGALVSTSAKKGRGTGKKYVRVWGRAQEGVLKEGRRKNAKEGKSRETGLELKHSVKGAVTMKRGGVKKGKKSGPGGKGMRSFEKNPLVRWKLRHSGTKRGGNEKREILGRKASDAFT